LIVDNSDAEAMIVKSQPNQIDVDRFQEKVHAAVRDRRPVHSADARRYVATLTPEQQESIKGMKYCHPLPGCWGFRYCVCAYFMTLWNCCLFYPCAFMGICLPFYSCLCCSCERGAEAGEGFGAWVTRDKHGLKTGEIILIDHERGTLVAYSTQCCSRELRDEPQCYCYNV
jgi:hypothetical protein